jgi:hypothetical protein
MLTVACSKRDQVEIVIETPANFSGQVSIQMGIPGTPPLKREGKDYQIAIPPDGKVITSTIIASAKPRFVNLSAGQVWGYTPSSNTTGDGVPVGATIEFFVGTKEQYESAQAKRHKSELDKELGPERLDRS